MARAEREALARLRIDTAFPRRQKSGYAHKSGATVNEDGVDEFGEVGFERPGRKGHGADDESEVLSELHTETPPISVPRASDHPSSVHGDISYSHKPEDIRPSPIETFLQNRRPSISFDPHVKLESGDHHVLQEPLVKRNEGGKPTPRTQMRPSGLRQQDTPFTNDKESSPQHFSPRRRERQRVFPTGSSRMNSLQSPAEENSVGCELDRPTSLTSISTASPLSEELRTPPEGPRDMLLSPFAVASPVQRSASLDDPSLWSGSLTTPFGSKPRSYTYDRNGSLRQSRRHSRRSTASSGKSPASTFLSMWSSRDEPAPQPDDEGQMVGTEYVLGKQIGFGGFSVVKEAYKVDESGETKTLAVKIVRKHVAGKSERENDQVQAEFDHEVRIWRYLNHPNVLTLDAVYETDYATFCFTRLAIGGTLFDAVRSNRQGLDMKLAKKYCYQLASAIRYLHEDARIVHRDIKLENCLLDPVVLPDGTKTSNLVLCDFGMAEWMSTDNGGNSPDPYDDAADRPPLKTIGPSDTSTSIAGSLEYASPELLSSPGGLIDPVVDVWAFGVVAYSVVVGSRPFQDSFSPRVTSNILNGNWNRDAVLGRKAHGQDTRDCEDALKVINGCLDMDIEKRWNIRDVLDSTWLRECSSAGSMDETVWKL
ncbi:hypothetical protein Plec18167_000850 [Paecilomyces lecythidis]|uniref:Protein kinase domain-containing protein n=1 Tax=Paecilomyces lecythidis TaxID=3004212 RepID=A0ABR3YC24_9EURO